MYSFTGLGAIIHLVSKKQGKAWQPASILVGITL